MTTIFDLSFSTPSGEKILLEKYRGNVVLIVNTATKCGLKEQFNELEALHQKYGEQGLTVIGFPCDQFMGQEPETNDSIEKTCKLNFGVTFQLSEKIKVNGKDTNPIFRHLKNQSGSILGRRIKWNFTKFLVSQNGEIVKRYSPTTKPTDMISDIEEMLAKTNTDNK